MKKLIAVLVLAVLSIAGITALDKATDHSDESNFTREQECDRAWMHLNEALDVGVELSASKIAELTPEILDEKWCALRTEQYGLPDG